MLIDFYSNYLQVDEWSFVESSTIKPYTNWLGILGSMMGNTRLQQERQNIGPEYDVY